MTQRAYKGEAVRRATSSSKNQIIDRMIVENIRKYVGCDSGRITERIRELDGEWDIERRLELTICSFALCGIGVSLIVGKIALIMPAILLVLFIFHTFRGWCPPLPVMRYFRVRTREEIDIEKYALKALRGDFEGLPHIHDAEKAFEAALKL